jgi:hypothetical protein
MLYLPSPSEKQVECFIAAPIEGQIIAMLNLRDCAMTKAHEKWRERIPLRSARHLHSPPSRSNISPVMNRGAGLPRGLANLGDTVRVLDRDGTDLGPMIVAKAQKLAADQNAELFVTDRTATPPVACIVDVRKLCDHLKKESGGATEHLSTSSPKSPSPWFPPNTT